MSPPGRLLVTAVMADRRSERVVANLNRALGELLAANDNSYLLGEDIEDPYGGAFKVTRGLSDRFTGRVLGTPISESAIVGAACGVALAGDIAIAEIMFGDFLILAFDQIVNFAAKAVSMYGRRVPMRVIIRSAVGGGRGYGATHSQSLQKHFIGVPDLVLMELSPFHDNSVVFEYMISLATPCVFFENKTLYAEPMCLGATYGEIFTVDRMDQCGPVRLFVDDSSELIDCLFITPGGTARRALNVARDLFLERELNCQVLVPAQLYPVDIDRLRPVLSRARRICVVEESTAGGTWGETVAQRIYALDLPALSGPVRLAHSADSTIPAAAHLEREMLVSEPVIREVAWPT